MESLTPYIFSVIALVAAEHAPAPQPSQPPPLPEIRLLDVAQIRVPNTAL